MTCYDTDGWGAYERHLDPDKQRVGKDNTQKMASTHLPLRTRITRLVRRTIWCSRRTIGTIWSLGCASI